MTQSNTADSYKSNAKKATDKNLGTWAWTKADKNGKAWLKFSFNTRVYSVKKVVWYQYMSNKVYLTWQCPDTDTDRHFCTGDDCDLYTLSVTTEKITLNIIDLPSKSDCKAFGNAVTLERKDGKPFFASDIAIAGDRQGNY